MSNAINLIINVWNFPSIPFLLIFSSTSSAGSCASFSTITLAPCSEVGIKEINKLPGLIFIVDPKKEAIAVREADRLDIPVVALIDTNSDPDLIDFPIPGNDDAFKSINLITRTIADAVISGRKEQEIAQAEAEAFEEKSTADKQEILSEEQ